MANSYDLLECSVCKKRSKRLILKDRIQLNKCNLTLKCLGKLMKLGESQVGANTDVLHDWVPRFSNTDNLVPLSKEADRISLMSGDNHFAMAISAGAGNPSSFLYTLREVKLSNNTFIEYQFILNQTDSLVISGKDDSAQEKLLTFTSDHEVVVYLNDIRLATNKFNRLIDGTIVLLLPLPLLVNTIRIYTYQFSVLDQVDLQFNKICDSESAWGNVQSIKRPGEAALTTEVYNVYTCTDFSELKNNVTYKVSDDQIFSASIKIYGLLSGRKLSNIDRDLFNVIDLRSTTNEYLYSDGLVLTDSFNVLSKFPGFKIGQLCQADLKQDNSEDEIERNEVSFIN